MKGRLLKTSEVLAGFFVVESKNILNIIINPGIYLILDVVYIEKENYFLEILYKNRSVLLRVLDVDTIEIL